MTKFLRGSADENASLGMACVRQHDRVLAAFHNLYGAATMFKTMVDVEYGGLLFALPVLLLNGLLSYVDTRFPRLKGYYSTVHILLTLCFIFLLRKKSIEQVRYLSVGELGKLIGLDRIPGVDTLRNAVHTLSREGDIRGWNNDLYKLWQSLQQEMVGYLYIDGHVRVYSGRQSKLPHHYVSRQKLCLRSFVDYWINDVLGRPFFCITQVPDPGLTQTIREEIIPYIESQLSESSRCSPSLHTDEHGRPFKYMLIFDREGYSPSFFKYLTDNHIGFYTYHKYPKESWPQKSFHLDIAYNASQVLKEYYIAQRIVSLGSNAAFRCREIRRLCPETGHQTSIITNDFSHDAAEIASLMFQRWSQENFFKYMKNHYMIDRLSDYGELSIDDTTEVINPHYRTLDTKKRSIRSKLKRMENKVGYEMARILRGESDDHEKVFDALEQLEWYKKELEGLKYELNEIPRHLPIGQLEEEFQFSLVGKLTHSFMNSIRMICYRAETMLSGIIKPHMGRPQDSRSLIRQVFQNSADILVDQDEEVIRIRLHSLSTAGSQKVISYLCDELNKLRYAFPGTNYRLKFNIGFK